MRVHWWVVSAALVCVLACGDDDGGGVRNDAGDEDAGHVACLSDDDCSDGVFCNGVERCLPSSPDAEGNGCVAGVPPRCDDGIECTTDTCSHLTNACRFVPIDADGDSHAAASCTTRDGEALGDDCDDNDPTRFPGNVETCTDDTATTDEDCDDTTLGLRDADADGALSEVCCNGDRCGTDCDDQRADVAAGYPEICDLVDNDCDGDVDVMTVEALWYPDDDGDGFGRAVPDPARSCAPLAGRSLFNTDLDDANPAINPAAAEICDRADNDCDGMTDEGDVCICGRSGAVPCECVTGAVDCYGGLIPRECLGGRWIAGNACAGVTPVCAMGACQCVGGGTACTAVMDRSPPFVIASAPGTARRVSRSAAVSILLSEAPAVESINASTFKLLLAGTPVPGSYTIAGELITLTPNTMLDAGRGYTVELSAVTDAAGNAMVGTHTFTFVTRPTAYPPETIGMDPSHIAVGPLMLESNPSGEALVSVGYNHVVGDTVAAGFEIFARSSDGQWSPRMFPPLPGFNQPVPGLGEHGTQYALTADNSTAFNYFRLPADPSWTQQTLGSASALRALAVGGDESCVVLSTGNSFSFNVPSVSGGFTATPYGRQSSPSALVVDGNASRKYVALLSGAETEVVLWQAPNGTPRGTLLVVGSTLPAVAINAAGRSVATWIEQDFRPNGLVPIATQALVYIEADGTAGSPIVLNQGAGHDRPTATWLADGSVLAVRREGGSLVAQQIASDGTIGPTLPLGTELAAQAAGELGTVAFSDGSAIVVWAVAPGRASAEVALLMTRYRNGVMEPSEVLVDTGVNGSLAVAPLPGDRALVVFDSPGRASATAIVVQ